MKQGLLISFTLALTAAHGAAQPTPRYTNAELVSLNAQTRVVVIKNNEGREQTLQMDDTLAGFEELRAGDRVILTVRDEPGLTRVSSIAKSQAQTVTASAPPPPRAAEASAGVQPGLGVFSDRVTDLARQAGQVDAVWTNFKTGCNVILRSSYPDGRDWFSLWEEGAAQMDVSSAACRELFNQIVSRGEAVKAGMARAEEAARRADLTPGDLRDVSRRHSMEWGGWGLPAPQPLKP